MGIKKYTFCCCKRGLLLEKGGVEEFAGGAPPNLKRAGMPKTRGRHKLYPKKNPFLWGDGSQVKTV